MNTKDHEAGTDTLGQYIQLAVCGAAGRRPSPVVGWLVSAAVACAVALVVAGSVSDWRNVVAAWVPPGVVFCGGVFIAEFIARWWAAPYDPAFNKRSPLLGRRGDYLFSFLGMVDMVVCAPFILSMAGIVTLASDSVVTGWLGAISVLSLFKLARYVSGLELIGAVLRNEQRILRSTVQALCVLVVIMSTLLFVFEQDAQPDVFKSIPHTLWWGIVTMTTTGYGDMAPVTLGGRVVGGVAMLLGIAMLAMPCGIVASGFATELRRRELLETWRTVSRLPLFANLDASSIAEIAGLLKTQIIPAHTRVISKGGFSDAMFFVADGEVEVDVLPKPVKLKNGDFFGETGLLEKAPRNANVNTVRQTRFLVLGLTDFHALIERQPEIRTQICAVSERRR